MIWVDWVIIAVLVISTGLSWLRGFVNEALSIAIWFLAIVVVFYFSPSLATVLGDSIAISYFARLMIARSILFISTLIIGSLFKRMVGGFVKLSGLSRTDRLLGVGFGFVRGVLLLLVGMTVARWIEQPEVEVLWNSSVLIPYLQEVEGNTLALAEQFFSEFLRQPSQAE